MAIDTEAIKKHIRGILVALGDDPDREGLKDTPDRVAKMYEEVFEGMNYTNQRLHRCLIRPLNRIWSCQAKVMTWFMSKISRFSVIVNIIWRCV